MNIIVSIEKTGLVLFTMFITQYIRIAPNFIYNWDTEHKKKFFN